MTMSFNLFTTDFDGLQLELFDGRGPIPLFLGAQPITDGIASFTQTAFNGYAVRLRSGDAPWLRSGARDLTSGIVDAATGNFAVLFYLVEPEAPVVVSPTALATLAPTTPFISRDDNDEPVALITELDIALVGDFLSASGTAVYLKTPLGGPVTYLYQFRLLPETDPVKVDRILKVETVNAVVKSASGGLLGWLINIFGDIIIAIFHDHIVAGLESTVEDEINATIQEALAEEGVAEGITVTAREVVVDPASGVTIRPVAAASTDVLCASVPASGSIRTRPRTQIQKLHLMRDRVLRKTAQGRGYIRVFEAFNTELVHILVSHPRILSQMDRVIHAGLKEFSTRNPEQGVLSPETARQGVILMEMVANAASPQLAAVIRGIVPEVNTFVGKPVGKVLQESERFGWS